jgi:hypothetical protein
MKPRNGFKLHNQGRRMTYSDLEHDERILKDKYKATYRQLMFRRYYIKTNSLDKFMREFPTTPDEAFQTSNVSVFDTSKINERLQNVLPPLSTNEVYDLLPDELKQYINKYLLIYRLPKKGMKMYAGVDVASGAGGDNSTMAIFNADGQQMASWKSNDIPVYTFAKIVNELGRFFKLCVYLRRTKQFWYSPFREVAEGIWIFEFVETKSIRPTRKTQITVRFPNE